MTWSVVVVECAMAAWLLSGVAPVMADRAAVGLLAIFISISAWRLSGGETDCGCFGGLRVHAGWTLALDCAVLPVFLVSGFRKASTPRPGTETFGRGPRVAYAVVLSTILPTSIAVTTYLRTMLAEPQHRVVIAPESWRGKLFPLLDFVDDDGSRADLGNGRRTVVLFSRGCSRCRAHLVRLASDTSPSGDPAAIRVMDMVPGQAVGRDDVPTALREIRLRSGVRYMGDVPWEISLNNGVVESVRQPQ